jgi:hypothetical protein
MSIQFLRQGIAARPARALKARSRLMRRLIQARDDPREATHTGVA